MPTIELILVALARELSRQGVDLSAWALSFARLLPSVVLIPAFGLRALPLLARVAIALALGAVTAPALSRAVPSDSVWFVTLLSQAVVGLPVAVGAATTLWVSTMTGNLLDQLARHSLPPQAFPTTDSETSALGVLLSLGACVAFLGLGGPARLVEALAQPAPPFGLGLRQVLAGLVGGLRIAALLAAPLLVLSVFFELLQGLLARVTSPVPVSMVLAPARAVLVLVIVALLLDRIIEGMTLWIHTHLPPG